MKNKYLIPLILLMVTLGFTDCSKDCEPKIATCNEKTPTGEICTAAFKRWFYNKDKNQCEEISYSGCSQKGFTTKPECEECKCK